MLRTGNETAHNLEVAQRQFVFFLPTSGASQESYSSPDPSFLSLVYSHDLLTPLLTWVILQTT